MAWYTDGSVTIWDYVFTAVYHLRRIFQFAELGMEHQMAMCPEVWGRLPVNITKASSKIILIYILVLFCNACKVESILLEVEIDCSGHDLSDPDQLSSLVQRNEASLLHTDDYSESFDPCTQLFLALLILVFKANIFTESTSSSLVHSKFNALHIDQSWLQSPHRDSQPWTSALMIEDSVKNLTRTAIDQFGRVNYRVNISGVSDGNPNEYLPKIGLLSMIGLGSGHSYVMAIKCWFKLHISKISSA
ncbi:hypothetical protein ARMGADRAFT_1038739 [Armillaria gallica]|uniref:Uncharacterized protein n=1 Tax=Armillaria gallica TaxID=47427 RepID=A0A2H3CGQ5_ARMGA|nr:hypothetical protein ARMGADRAFT_1038739 [Armillaria gallica]